MAMSSKSPMVTFFGSCIFTNFCFLSHNFGSIFARNPIKLSNVADYSLESKQNWAKNGSLGWRLQPGNLSQELQQKFLHFDVTLRKPQTQGKKNFLIV